MQKEEGFSNARKKIGKKQQNNYCMLNYSIRKARSNMKFIRSTIPGFGRLTDTNFDFPKGELTYFYGENEAGKSTLQQFLLYMLFGLTSKKRKQYRPKNRTEIGGTLT